MIKNIQELDKVIRKRKMIRKYDQTREVPENIIDKLIDNASRLQVLAIPRFRNL